MGIHQKDYYVREKARRKIQDINIKDTGWKKRYSLSGDINGGQEEVKLNHLTIKNWLKGRYNLDVIYIPMGVYYNSNLIKIRIVDFYEEWRKQWQKESA